MSVQPETHFARTSEGAVAYQVVGDGPIDVVFVPDWSNNIVLWWEQPLIERFLGRLASFSRLILFDKRGSGASDAVPLGSMPTLEQWSDDVRVVMDAVGSERAAVYGHGAGSPMALMFAASYPERTAALVVCGGFARLARATDYPGGIPAEVVDPGVNLVIERWGREDNPFLSMWNPSLLGDKAFMAWLARYLMLTTSLAMVEGLMRWGFALDLRSVLPTISAPTLVLHRTGDPFILPTHGRYIAEHIPGAKHVELSGVDHLWYAGDQDAVLDEIQAFLTGTRGTPEIDRVLATFDGRARAIRCAGAMGQAVRDLGIEIRAGLHTGEVELRGADIGGISVALAARVMAEAGPSETLVSSTVKDLVVGSGIEFEERGAHALKGVPGEWRLYAVKS